MKKLLLILSLTLGFACGRALGEPLPGFSLNGQNWTYDPGDGGALISGVLLMPGGSGPLPGVVLSHGLGGSAQNIATGKGAEMSNWGMVCIAPNYTHAGDPANVDFSQAGARPENVRRAMACLTILRSLDDVDANRLAAYGHSMGAFVTIALAAAAPDSLTAAAITAGGVITPEYTVGSAPTAEVAAQVRAPFLILQGATDTTVPPESSELFKTVLDAHNVPNARHLFEGVGHNLPVEREEEVNQLIHDWFTQWSVLPVTNQPATPEAIAAPRGIYVLDSQAGTMVDGVSMRDANIRSKSFVAGYALRADWGTMEPAQDQFDFTLIDWNVRKLAAIGKKLSLLFINTDPAWLAETSGVTTWFDSSLGRNRAVPWDGFLLTRFETFLHALAEHRIDGVKFKDHPVLGVVNTGLPGTKLAIRDPSPLFLRDLPGYSRADLTDAVLRSLRAAVTNFPAPPVQIGFWPVADAQASPSLWEALRQSILAEFNGTTRPRVGFWMENLAASRPGPGQDPVSGKPSTMFGGPLYLSQSDTWANFQALTSWKQPFNNYGDSVANATPADGMFYALNTFGSTYFELYVADIDHAAYRAELEMWHARLFPPDRVEIRRDASGMIELAWPSFTGGVYQVEHCTSLGSWSNAGLSIIATTSVTAWSETAVLPRQFYRVRTLP